MRQSPSLPFGLRMKTGQPIDQTNLDAAIQQIVPVDSPEKQA